MTIRAGHAGLWTIAVAVGLLTGIGAYTFLYGQGLSYFSTDPAACTNCHIMQGNFDSWVKSSHHGFAKCVDCHLPHNPVLKLASKADQGFRHSWGFTFQNFHEPIQTIPRSQAIIQGNCLRCHQDFVHSVAGEGSAGRDAIDCFRCHASVGHAASR